MSSFSSSYLLYPNASPSSTTGSLADSGYASAHERLPSCTSSPVRPPIVVPPPPPMSTVETWMPPSNPIPVVKKPTRVDVLTGKKHVPRPPNAFMLFRSLMINTRIPKIENRQQNVSRIAGEIWNKLEDDVKKAWHAKAEEVQRQHKIIYPDYKFTPSRKVVTRPKEESGEELSQEDLIRHLREKYTGVMGPAVPPTRKRKSKARKVKFEDDDYEPSARRVHDRAQHEHGALHMFPPSTYSPARPQPSSPMPAPPLSQATSSRRELSRDLAVSELLGSEARAGLSHASYGTRTSSHSMPAMPPPPKTPSRRTSTAKADHEKEKSPIASTSATTIISVDFSDAPLPSSYNNGPGGFGSYAHGVLALGDLELRHSSLFPSLYEGSQSFHGSTSHDTPPSDTPDLFPGFNYNFSDELLASMVHGSGSGLVSSSVAFMPAPAPGESMTLLTEEPRINVDALLSPVIRSAGASPRSSTPKATQSEPTAATPSVSTPPPATTTPPATA